MYIKSVEIKNANPAESYTWSDMSGSSDSIKFTGSNAVSSRSTTTTAAPTSVTEASPAQTSSAEASTTEASSTPTTMVTSTQSSSAPPVLALPLPPALVPLAPAPLPPVFLGAPAPAVPLRLLRLRLFQLRLWQLWHQHSGRLRLQHQCLGLCQLQPRLQRGFQRRCQLHGPRVHLGSGGHLLPAVDVLLSACFLPCMF